MRKAIVIVSFSLLGLTGCVTTQQQQVEDRQRHQWESQMSKTTLDQDTKISNLRLSVERLRQSQAGLEDRLASLENRMARSRDKRQGEFNALRSEIRALESSTGKKINAILDEVSRENERLLKHLGRRGKSAYMQGYEHVVRTGDTLSSIAHQYKARVKAIVEANQLDNPNSLRVGQKLFIPQ